MASARAPDDYRATADDAAVTGGLLADESELFGDMVMDWQQVMARPDWTIAEKRERYVAQCRIMGMEPYPEVHQQPKRRQRAK